MAKSKPKVKKASIHSRAARRATSPSINTDKSLKNAKPPTLPGANVVRNSSGASTGANTGARVSKRGKKQRKTRDQRLRLERAVQRAETVMDQRGKKVEVSRRRERTVKERSSAWEDINGKIGSEGKKKQKTALMDDDDENGEWEDAGDTEEELVTERVGRMKVEDPGTSMIMSATDDDGDEIL